MKSRADRFRKAMVVGVVMVIAGAVVVSGVIAGVSQ